MPSTSLSNTETDIAVAARNSRPLPISMDLVFSMLGVSLFRFSLLAILDRSFVKSILEIFYVRGVAIQNSIVRIKEYAAVIDSSRQAIYVNKET